LESDSAVALDFLPEALVDEMLNKTDGIIDKIRIQIESISKLKNPIRSKLKEIGLLRNIAELLAQKTYPTTVGIDGTYSIIKQLSIDTVAIAAVAVEGLLPPKEERPWERPRHVLSIFPVSHHTDTSTLCRAIMFAYELELALKAPHNVVFLDGSLISYLIGISQGLYAICKSTEKDNAPIELMNHYIDRLGDTLKNYCEVLITPKIDRIYVGIPKYSSRNEIIEYLNKFDIGHEELGKFNDKGLLSLVLKAGDVVGPVKMPVGGKWRLHLDGVPGQYDSLRDQIMDALDDIHVLYFKPSASHPTLRVEIAGEVARNKNRLSVLLDALYDQSRIPGVIEPYPIHIADMFVKNVHGSLHELRDASLSDIGEIPGIDFSDIYFFLHNYRSEGGFE